MIGTEIIPFGPLKAEKNGLKEFSLHFKIMTRSPFYFKNAKRKLVVLEGPSNLILWLYSIVGGVLETSCYWLSNEY